MAKVKESKESGKATQAATWNDGLKAEAGDTLIIKAGHTVEYNTSVEVLAVEYQKGSGLTGTGNMSVGGSGAGPENVLVKLHPELSTYTWTGGIVCSGLKAATEQTVSLGGHKIGEFTSVGEANRKIKLLEDVKCKSAKFAAGATAIFNMNEKTLEAEAGIEFAENMHELICTKAKLVSLGSGIGTAAVTIGVGVTVTGSNSCTIEASNETETEKKLNIGEREWGTILVGRFVAINSNITIKTEFGINSKGAAEGKGVRILAAEITLGSSCVITSTGTSPSPARLETKEPGVKKKINFPASPTKPENSIFVMVRDIEVFPEAVTWYLPSGKDASTESKVNTSNVRIEFNSPTNPGLLAGIATLKFPGTPPLSAVAAPKGSATLRFVDTPPLAAVAAIKGSATLRFVDTPRLSAVAAAKGSATLRFVDSALPSARAALAGTSNLRFPGAAPLQAAGTLSGASTLRFQVTPGLSAVGGLRGSSVLRFVEHGELLEITAGRLAAAVVLRFVDHGNVFVPKWVGTAVGTVGPVGTIDVVINPTASVTSSVTPVGNVSTQIEVA